MNLGVAFSIAVSGHPSSTEPKATIHYAVGRPSEVPWPMFSKKFIQVLQKLEEIPFKDSEASMTVTICMEGAVYMAETLQEGNRSRLQSFYVDLGDFLNVPSEVMRQFYNTLQMKEYFLKNNIEMWDSLYKRPQPAK